MTGSSGKELHLNTSHRLNFLNFNSTLCKLNGRVEMKKRYTAYAVSLNS